MGTLHALQTPLKKAIAIILDQENQILLKIVNYDKHKEYIKSLNQ